MAIPALLIGAGVVGGMWLASQPPKVRGDAKVNPATANGHGGTEGTTGTAGDLSQIAASVAAAGGQPVEATQQPAATGGTTTTTEGDTGAVQSTTNGSTGGTTGTTQSPPTPTFAGPAGPATAPAPSPVLHVVNLDAAYLQQAGAGSTKVDQSQYYTNAAAAGQIIY